MGKGLEVEFWGTRGSAPAPFADRTAYGGNTSCVCVWQRDGRNRADSGQPQNGGPYSGLAVFDCGTGIIPLGQRLEEMCRQGLWKPEIPVHIFISHLHLDHIQGFPMFSWLFRKEAVIHLYGCSFSESSFRQQMETVMGHPYWPVSVGQVPASVVWHEINTDDVIPLWESGRVRVMESAHPDGGLLFRLEQENASVVYGLDCELGGRAEEETFREAYRKFAEDCSLLIFDAPYTEQEYPAVRGYGHSFWQMGVRMAEECRAKELCVCHHEWSRTDAELEAMGRELEKAAEKENLKVWFAREGIRAVVGGDKK